MNKLDCSGLYNNNFIQMWAILNLSSTKHVQSWEDSEKESTGSDLCEVCIPHQFPSLYTFFPLTALDMVKSVYVPAVCLITRHMITEKLGV